jgi:hypothetical protein
MSDQPMEDFSHHDHCAQCGHCRWPNHRDGHCNDCSCEGWVEPPRPPAVEEARAAQYIAWSYADHECGGKDRGICGACDDRADSILRKFQPIIAAARAEGRQDIQKLSDNFEACAAHNIEWRDRFNRAHAMWADAVAQLADSQRAWDEVSKIMKFTNNDPWLLVGAVKAAVERKLDNKND